MYNLLIVDDEKIIREGIYELLSMDESLELNLSTAASGVEAQQILESRKIDIVLTDIQMPQMTGIELMALIQERWPYCKIIFLTGYSEFDYVYKVHQHARYVLKAEEDSKIIEAVRDAIDEIENDFLIESMVRDTGRWQQQQKGYERAIFMEDLLDGFASPENLTQELADGLGMALDVEKDTYYLVMKFEGDETASYHEWMKRYESMQLLLDKYFFEAMEGIAADYSKSFLLLLLQPKKLISQERRIRMIQGTGELFQKACMKNFNLTVSMIIGAEPAPIPEIIERFQTLKPKLLMLSESNIMKLDKEPQRETNSENEIRNQHINLIHSRIQMIDYYFENSNEELVTAVVCEVSDLFNEVVSMHDLLAVEIYSNIAAKLLGYINRFELSQEMCFKISVINLYNVTLHKSWREAFDYLIEIIHFIFELKQANQDRKNVDVINRIKKYIKEHLSDDTSLDVLADHAQLSPEYLLRLFKKREDMTILQYVNDLKLIKAKRMLEDFNKPIKDIAQELGFTSSGYFSRFFKSKTGVTPQNYREKVEENRKDTAFGNE